MRAGCIDIGSNTTRLLVADVTVAGLVEVHQDRVFTRIGQGLGPDGRIAEAKIAEVVEVVLRQARLAAQLGVDELRGVATAAIRRAPNGGELLAAVTAASGVPVVVLSGEQEARLAFRGATSAHPAPPGTPVAVIDVGGGSSEIVVGTMPAQVDWWASADLGSSSLTEGCLPSDPPTVAELAAGRAMVARAFTGLAPPRPTPPLALAVGGSATSLCRLAGDVLDGAALDRALTTLVSAPAAEVAVRHDIDPQRARLLPAGLLILEAGAELLQARLEVGRGGIREGVLVEALGP